MSWVNTVFAAAQRLGVTQEALLRAAGICADELDHERWPVDHITRLWRAAARLTGDPGFGLKAGSQVGPASFNVVSYLLQSAPSLRESIALVQRYQRLISDGGRVQMIPGNNATWLIYHPCQGQLPFSPHQIEAVLAAVVALGHRLTGNQLLPLKVQFSQSPLGPLDDYHCVFRCPVEFDQAFSGILIDNAALDTPLAQAEAPLVNLHRQYVSARLAALSKPDDLAQELSAWIRSRLPGQPPTRAMAAQALGLSPKTLARRLQQDHLDFSTLLDQARRDAALLAVSSGDLGLADIGHSLGFAEPSIFWRAFKRWTGMTPAQWRQRAVAGRESAQVLEGLTGKPGAA
ncbi:AraC family transcriptional regulator [Pseudomonas sp. L-22-4S-12]|uniref:AraC family transcriptional regulator n=1 Tax=Pseudomonas sp. L-22-4S-12 TaxID=2610893 RepID=UPI002114CEC3|nr:AraC family transcriptional regulator [Pseudomonas sp. L-22-4S-12]